MRSVTVHKAKTTLSQLIAAVEAGEEVLIHRGRDPVARLVPVDAVPRARRFGALAGKVALGNEFFEPLSDDELSAWER
jgi:prevent-host-death family protein